MQRVIYPSYRGPLAFGILLGCSKFMRCVSLFLLTDLLAVNSLIGIAYLVYFWSTICLVLIQKPYSSGKRLTRSQWVRVSRYAVFTMAANLLWMLGLTLCGPMRTVLLSEHADIVVVTLCSALFAKSQNTDKVRGVVFFILGYVAIAFFDHDSVPDASQEVAQRYAYVPAFVEDLIDSAGLSDHKGGVFLLLLTLLLRTALHTAGRKLAVDVGGAKRLNALTMMTGTALLTPFALANYLLSESDSNSIISTPTLLLLTCCVGVVIYVVDYYVESVCLSHLEALRTARTGTLVLIGSALLLSQFAPHPILHVSAQTDQLSGELSPVDHPQHQLSAGLVFALIMFLFPTLVLSSRGQGHRSGSLIGFSAGGLPLYASHEPSRHQTQSLSYTLKSGLQQILRETDSRRIFYFLVLNLMFTFVELVYGGWTNSLGLISDGFHMLFDCTALVMGLYAAVMSKWQPTAAFSYGYDRVEVLSGFINGLFLTVIAFFILLESVHRLLDPPTVNTNQLLTVSVLGLLVNLVGILAFQGAMHGHSHGGGGHGHSHGGHGHSHGAHSHGGEQSGFINSNMKGVFLHVLADTLGSVGVIISALLIEHFGWTLSDPICSLFISGMISLSVVPLLKETGSLLILQAPDDIQGPFYNALQKITTVDGVLSYRAPHVWRHSNKAVWATVHVIANTKASEQHIATQVAAMLKESGVTNVSVQIEKEAYYTHRMGLGATPEAVEDAMSTTEKLNFDTDLYSIKAI